MVHIQYTHILSINALLPTPPLHPHTPMTPPNTQAMAEAWDPDDLMVPFEGYTPYSMVSYNTNDPTLKHTVSVEVDAPADTCFRLFDDVLNWGEWFNNIHRVWGWRGVEGVLGGGMGYALCECVFCCFCLLFCASVQLYREVFVWCVW